MLAGADRRKNHETSGADRPYDQALGLEAYSLRAVDRPFPSHFHDHYVIGVVEQGTDPHLRPPTAGHRPGRRAAVQPGRQPCLHPGGRGSGLPGTEYPTQHHAGPGGGDHGQPGNARLFRGRGSGRRTGRPPPGPAPGGAGEEPGSGGRRQLLLAWGLLLPGYAGMVKRFLPAGWRWSGPVRSSGATMPGISRWRSSAFRRD